MATPFCFTKDILTNKEYIMNSENEGDYVPFVVNRVLSNYPDCIFYVQEMNMHNKCDPKMQYDYYMNSIKASRRKFVKYPKKEKSEHVGLIMEVYKYSAKKAREALEILSDEQIEEIKRIYEKGG